MFRLVLRGVSTLLLFVTAAAAVFGAGITAFFPDVQNAPWMERALYEEYALHDVVDGVGVLSVFLGEAVGATPEKFVHSIFSASLIVLAIIVWSLISGVVRRRSDRDPLYENKGAALILIALLIVFTPPIVSSKIAHGISHAQKEDGVDEAGIVTAARAELTARILAADPLAGERRSGLCAGCHSLEKDGAAIVGPTLYGVVGREIAGLGNYAYSPALRNREGVWTYDELDAYLADSQSYAPGGMMAQRVPNENHRAEIIAYLETLNDE